MIGGGIAGHVMVSATGEPPLAHRLRAKTSTSCLSSPIVSS
jgi:hypothetical protein